LLILGHPDASLLSQSWSEAGRCSDSSTVLIFVLRLLEREHSAPTDSVFILNFPIAFPVPAEYVTRSMKKEKVESKKRDVKSEKQGSRK
jgi:hypothetical protein